jgi:hypothetical protein
VPRRLLGQRLLATAGVLLAVLVGAGTLYAAVAVEPGPASPRTQVFASGAMSVSSSKDGSAIFDPSRIGPGGSAGGEVTIANSGAAPGTLTLSSLDLSDASGLYGGTLSGRLDLRIADVTASLQTEVYAGELASMPELQLGTLGPNESRTFRFAVEMRDGGAPSSPYVDDNLYQRASTSIGYLWTLTETEAGSQPPHPPAPNPVAPPAVPPEAVSPPPDAGSEPLRLLGDSHPNSLVGTNKDDLIYGFGGPDVIFARAGDDKVRGGAGTDRIHGGRGDDRLWGGSGRDYIYGGSGADLVFARDGVRDFVHCGSDSDSAYVDRYDRTRNCEAIWHDSSFIATSGP